MNNLITLPAYNISISQNSYLNPSNHILIYFDKYKFKKDPLTTPQEKISFIYTYIFEFDIHTTINYVQKLISWLKEDKINFIIEDYPLYYPSENIFYFSNKYIDPESVSILTLTKLFKNKNILYHFLFSDDSIVEFKKESGE